MKPVGSANFNPPIDHRTVAARAGNQIVGLGDLYDSNEHLNLVPISRESPEGARIFKRSIAFLLGAACQKCNFSNVKVMESIGSSFHFEIPEIPITAENANMIEEEMRTLAVTGIAITRCSLSRAEATKQFARQNESHTTALIQSSSKATFDCYVCQTESHKSYVALAHGPLVHNTADLDINLFRVNIGIESFPHFRLCYAVPTGGGFELRDTLEVKLVEAYQHRKVWNSKLDLSSVPKTNRAILNNRSKSLIQLSEALHDNQVVNIANQIVNPSSGATQPKLVLIAGPSSSGKTTFAKRLCVALETLTVFPIVISVDSYYKAWQEIDDRGMSHVDWESLHALNTDLLNEHLIDLIAGKEVLIPEYNMHLSEPMSKEHWVKTSLPAGGILIMEGIHCLNPNLTPRVTKEEKYHIMISPLSALILDDSNFISSSQIRMMRRMVRDFLFRGRSATSTLKQWPGVALGERTNIYPNQNNADIVMNSGLVYEVNVLKVYAEPLLKSITSEQSEYAEAQRLLSVLEWVTAMPATAVPPQSLLREFIGGSWFYEYSGMYKAA